MLPFFFRRMKASIYRTLQVFAPECDTSEFCHLSQTNACLMSQL
uniref:TOPII n=1 Tax=Arundo donax TaxID=35708 RepID=A0A0A9AN44_ARUDO